MQAGRRRIKTDVTGDGFLFQQLPDLRLIRDLFDKTPLPEYIVYALQRLTSTAMSNIDSTSLLLAKGLRIQSNLLGSSRDTLSLSTRTARPSEAISTITP